MALASNLGIIETDRLTAVASAASAVTAATISIADSCTLITGFILLYAWQLRHSPTRMQYIYCQNQTCHHDQSYCPLL